MKAGSPLSYLPDNRFSLVEERFYRRTRSGRIIPGDEINDLEPVIAALIHYIGLALTIESRYRKIEKIKFCIYDLDHFDALGFAHAQSGIVIISLGTIRYCYNLAYALAATSEIADTYGLFAKSEINHENFQRLFRYDGGLPELSFNEKRLQVAYKLAGLALAGIAFHEAAHIINGHSRYLDENNEADNVRLIQALEYDADCYTVPALVNLTRTINARGGSKLITDYGQIVEVSSFAAAMPFAIAGCEGLLVSDGFDPEKNKHPPYSRRCWSVFGVGQEMLVRAKCPRDVAADSMTALQMRLIRATALVMGSELKILNSKFISEIESRLTSLGEFKDIWAEIRPRLAPFKIGIGSLAPADPRDQTKESLNIIASEYEIDLLKPRARD